MSWPYSRNWQPEKSPEDVSCVLCLDCGTLLASTHVHDYRTCSCPNEAMNDGGDSYIRCGAMDLSRIVAGRLNLTTWEFKEFTNFKDTKNEI